MPTLPWYPPLERALAPTRPYVRVLLLATAAVCAWAAIAWDATAAWGFWVYLIAP